MDGMDFLSHIEGTALHDGWKSYLNYLCGHYSK
jgi:hypothetical protein